MQEVSHKGSPVALNIAKSESFPGQQPKPPMVLLHGVTRRWQTYWPLIPSLQQRFSLHLIDFRGHGRSARHVLEGDNARGYRVVDYVDDPVNYISRCIPEPIVLYGHSLGAMVAAAVAAACPEKVQTLILEDPPMETMGARIRDTVLFSFFECLTRYANDQREVSTIAGDLGNELLNDPVTNAVFPMSHIRDETTLRFSARSLQQLDPRVLEPIVRGQWLEGYHAEAILANIVCPTLLLQADPQCGGMLIDEDIPKLRDLVRDLCHVRITGCPHLMHVAQSQTLLNHIWSFLDSR